MKALVIGRHVVADLLANDAEVTLLTRGISPNPFADCEGVTALTGTRNERTDLKRARDAVDPDVVLDMVALVPGQVRMAAEVFAAVDAYVVLSSGSAYAEPAIPFREDESPLHGYTDEHVADGMPTTLAEALVPAYGPRKAECDRAVFAAAEAGVNATTVRSSFVYGPYDYTGRMDYWIDRVASHDRVVVPGDGDYLFNQVYAADLAAAIRLVAERGTPGEAYNVADRTLLTREELVRAIAAALDREVEVVPVPPAMLAAHDLAPTDFPLTLPFPLLMDTAKVAALGWSSTPPATAIAATVEEFVGSGRTPTEGPDRVVEEELIAAADPSRPTRADLA